MYFVQKGDSFADELVQVPLYKVTRLEGLVGYGSLYWKVMAAIYFSLQLFPLKAQLLLRRTIIFGE
jgi:hypothetical protein